MIEYLARRVSQALLVLLGVSLIVFVILHLSGDPARLILPLDATEKQVTEFRETMGFNDPLPIQYARFMGKAVRGDMGYSFRQGQPALDLILERLPATFALASTGIALAILVAVPLGILAAIYRGSAWDAVAMGLAMVGQATPVHALGLMLMVVFSVHLGWLPTSGWYDASSLVLPGITLAAFSMARIARMTRSSMLDVLGQDYIRTARAKGIREGRVIYRYALKSAAIPLVTIVGLEFGVLLGGAVITETVFAWPGVGRLAVDSIFARDYPVVQAVVLIMATVFVTVNLAVDLLYTYLDPRIREGGSAA